MFQALVSGKRRSGADILSLFGAESQKGPPHAILRAILRRGGWFLWLRHTSRRLGAAWGGGGAGLRRGAALERRNSLVFRVTYTFASGHAARSREPERESGRS